MSSPFKLFVIALWSVTMATAKTLDDDECPDFSGMDNFSLYAFLGKWYEVERYPTARFENHTCIQIDYQQTSQNSTGVYIDKDAEYVENGVQIQVDIKVLYPASNTQGQFIYNPERFDDYNVFIIDTDYNTYHIRYNCQIDNETGQKFEEAFIFSRTGLLSDKELKEIKKVLKKMGSDTSKFQDFSDCI